MSPVKRNSFFGLLGFAIPAAIVILAYPVLMRGLGAAAFGVYLLATSMSGALAFLDAGFSSATLKFVAEDVTHGRTTDAARVIVASLLFYGFFGAACATVLWFLAPWLTGLFQVDAVLRLPAIWTFRLAALQFAVFMLSTVFISLFKGVNKFHLSTASLSLLSIFTYAGGAIGILFFHAGVVALTATSLAANLLVLTFSGIVGVRLCHAHGIHLATARPARATFRRMLAFGSVMTVNSVSAMLLYQIQKFLVGSVAGPAAVTIYQTASIPPSKIHAAVNAFTETLFPLTSGSPDRRRLRRVYLGMLGGTFALAVLAFAPLMLASRQIVTFWLGPKDAAQVLTLLPVFAIAYAFLALSPAPFHLLNGMGKPWLNTIFFAGNAIANVLLLAFFHRSGLTLMNIAWSFAIANIITAIAYQLTVELVIWRNPRGADDRLVSSASSPLISILIPTHNREPYIAACIQSAQAQTYPHIEIIIVDNCSTDRTWQICQTFAAADPRIRLFRNPTNIGPVLNWARCFAEADGAYGKILFSDDELDPSYLTRTAPWLADPEIGFVFTAAAVGPTRAAAETRYRWKPGKVPAGRYLRQALGRNSLPLSPGAALFRMEDLRRNLLSNIPSPTIADFADHGAGPDLLLYLLTAKDYPAVAHVAEPLTFFRSHPDSISHRKLARLSACYSQARIWFAAQHGRPAELRRALAAAWLSRIKQDRRWISPPDMRKTHLLRQDVAKARRAFSRLSIVRALRASPR